MTSTAASLPCWNCGAQVDLNRPTCVQCGKEQGGRHMLAMPEREREHSPFTGLSVVAALVAIGAVLVTLFGFTMVSEATIGVGIIAAAAVFAIVARMLQAAAHTRAILYQLRKR
jgi:hypothetical protein